MTAVRVLLVDDEKHILVALDRHLSLAGLECAAVSSADDALTAIAREAFDCVVADIRMPGKTGLELLQAVRDLDPTLPVILMTAAPHADPKAAAAAVGAFAYMCKPFSADDLIAVVEAAAVARRAG